jgi:hypothetical protein
MAKSPGLSPGLFLDLIQLYGTGDNSFAMGMSFILFGLDGFGA